MDLADQEGQPIQDEPQARRLRGLLEKIEDVAFTGGKPKAFEVFRAFDVDGDGFDDLVFANGNGCSNGACALRCLVGWGLANPA